MARKSRQRPPAYTLHKPSGKARVRINGQDHYLGPHNSAESHQKYARLIAEWSVSSPFLTNRKAEPAVDSLTLAELLLKYLQFAQDYYVNPDGSSAKEYSCMKDALRPVGDLYSLTLVRDFGPLALKAVRSHMIELGWARTHINRSINRIRRAFKWGVSSELVEPSILNALQTVSGLRQGRTNAKESEPIRPVALDRVERVLPHVSRQVAAMIQLQLLYACRPGEIVAMRDCDIDKSGEIWIYSPGRHKTAWRGHQRQIYLGMKAQEILKEFRSSDGEAYLFRPCDAMAEYQNRKTSKRKTPLSCGNRPGTNRVAKPKKSPGQKYTSESYAKAIATGCKLAFPPPESIRRSKGETEAAWKLRLTSSQKDELKCWHDSQRWSPNQLRHSTGTEIRREFGVEAAQVVLGHSRADVTQVYAERNAKLAIDVMLRRG